MSILWLVVLPLVILRERGLGGVRMSTGAGHVAMTV